MIDLAKLRMPLVPGDVIEGWNDPEIEAYFRHSYVVALRRRHRYRWMHTIQLPLEHSADFGGRRFTKVLFHID